VLASGDADGARVPSGQRAAAAWRIVPAVVAGDSGARNV
jgi:hypothetical protein